MSLLDGLSLHPATLGLAASAGSLALAALTMVAIGRWLPVPAAGGRFVPIDGLRGYLAFFVFLHHCHYWHGLLCTGSWGPSSLLGDKLGSSSVALFFMITGFLFSSRLLDARHASLDWLRLMVSRVTRLTPLYGFAMLVLFAFIGHLTDWRLHVSPGQLARQMAWWLAFNLPGFPDINGFHPTWLITAGVSWTLCYELVFYMSLPLLGLVLGARPSWKVLLAGVVVLALTLCIWRPAPTYARAFGGGLAAAFCVRVPAIVRRARSLPASLLGVLLLAIVAVAYPSGWLAVPLLLLTLVFILVACGNDFFGVLSLPCSRRLGEISYSVYLLHGIVLFATFAGWRSPGSAAAISDAHFWLLTLVLTPIVLVIATCTFLWIEKPGMALTPALTLRLRRLLDR